MNGFINARKDELASKCTNKRRRNKWMNEWMNKVKKSYKATRKEYLLSLADVVLSLKIPRDKLVKEKVIFEAHLTRLDNT